MGIFDPDEAITAYSLKQAIEDGGADRDFQELLGAVVRRQADCGDNEPI